MSKLELSEIQGFVLRGHRAQYTTFLLLAVRTAAAARFGLGELVSGRAYVPQLTVATPWVDDKEPDYVLNLGITWRGLVRLGLAATHASSFEPAFIAGAAARAEEIGDREHSAPANWRGGLGDDRVHVVISLSANQQSVLDERLEQLVSGLVSTGGFEQLDRVDAQALGNDMVHFGYRDSISQPTIEGAPGPAYLDPQEPVPASRFVLLDLPKPRLPGPADLTRNGSFGVFRIMKQETHLFHQLLERNKGDIDPELLAAKLVGRWRNGTPLSLSPTSDRPLPVDRDLNRFDYVKSAGLPGSVDDPAGLRCPVGAHIRRTNPRGMRVTGGDVPEHRIVRRGVPYGPPYQPGVKDDVERGLVGFFINASIQDQFEHIMKVWVNGDGFMKNLPRESRDPLGTADATRPNQFAIPREGKDTLQIALDTYIQTRGAAYCLLPSRSGLRYLAGLQI